MVKGELEVTAPLVLKKDRKSNNGRSIIPVFIDKDTFNVYFDADNHVFFAFVKIEGKRIRFIEDK